MPPQAISLRPQTTRQARRAYQKAGGTPRLSAVELRRLERSAELQERAARIKAHNDRARENKRKKAEKLEKEREARKRMGIPEPTKFKVGSSQLSLGAFVGTGIKRKREESDCPGLSLEDCVKIEYPVPDKVILKQEEDTRRHSEHPAKDASTGEAAARQTGIPLKEPMKNKFATAASLMPPPPPRPPLHELSANPMAQNTPRSIKDELIDRTETDWDSLFDSNTQIEREISDVKKQPATLTLLEKPAERTPARSPRPIPSEDFTDICTQDLDYSSPTPPITKDCSHAKTMSGTDSEEEREKTMEEYMDRVDEEEAWLGFLHPWEEPTFPFKKQRPDSELSEQELEWISIVIGGIYDNLRIGHSHVKTLVAGRRLPCPGEAIPPWLVAQMAVKLEENRQNGIGLWSVHKLRLWAEKVQKIVVQDGEGRRVAAVAAVAASDKVNKDKVAEGGPVMNSDIDFAKGKTITGPLKQHASAVEAATKRIEVEETASIDEFEEFGLSSQDLRELDI
ncbi:MAG: hypothetical protein Q9184_000401 [Pyrenodesmia sp. 2 TL-2023]